MNRTRTTLLAALVILSVPTTTQLLENQIPATRDQAVLKLEIGKPVERGIDPGETHTYEIMLAEGQFLRAVIDQRGIDVMVTVFDAKGKKSDVIDGPTGSQGPEPLAIKAADAGPYRLEIKSLEKEPSPGRYEVRITELLGPEEYSAFTAQQEARHKDVIAWLHGHAVRLRTVRAGNGFDDLQSLKGIIGSARIVALGEATHGTREFFQLKHRMLEFLVQEMGFTIFAIEAPMPEAFDINEYVLTGKGDPERAIWGLSLWPWITEEVLDMIRWMRAYNQDDNHRQKIKFYGFDLQTTSRAVTEAIGYLRKLDPDQALLMEKSLAVIADPFLERDFRSQSRDEKGALLDVAGGILARFDEHRDEYVRLTSVADWTLARQHLAIVVQNLESQASPPTLPTRDSAMAANIRWILDQEGPDSRMVLWAHNGHIANIFLSVGSMGWNLRKMFGTDLITFGFAFNRGSFQAVDMPPSTAGRREFSVDAAPEETLDGTLAAAGLSIAAVDLREIPRDGPVADWFNRPLATRNIGAGYSEQYAEAFFGPQFPQILTHQFDAILFTENTTASHSLEWIRRMPAGSLGAPENLDFESGERGDPPPGWVSPTGLGSKNFVAATSDDHPRTGVYCAVIRRLPGQHAGEAFGSLSQSIEATPYRNKRILLRASVRVEPGDRNDKAYLWLRVLRQATGSQAQAFYENMADHPITNNEWKEYEISGSVPADATTIEFGLAFVGDGEAAIDAVSVEVSDY